MPARRTRPFRSRRWRVAGWRRQWECRTTRAFQRMQIALAVGSRIRQPDHKKTVRHLDGEPGQCGPARQLVGFRSIPGTLPMPPPAKSGSKWNVSSTTRLAGSDISRLRFSSSVILNLRKGMSTLARTATSSDCPARLMISVPCHRANVSLAVRIGGVFLNLPMAKARGF